MVTSVAAALRTTSGWERSFEILVGIFSIVAALLVWAFPGVAVLTLLALLAVGLLLTGVASVSLGISARGHPAWVRGLRVVLGLFVLVTAGFVVVAPAAFGIGLLVFLLAFVLMFTGVAHVFAAGGTRGQPRWHRDFEVLAGVLAIVLAFFVLYFPLLAVLSLVILLSVGLFFSGVEWLVAGITGVRWAAVFVRPAPPQKA
jgi:uncharacterized membrane protein HdeD (DUF308 family)